MATTKTTDATPQALGYHEWIEKLTKGPPHLFDRAKSVEEIEATQIMRSKNRSSLCEYTHQICDSVDASQANSRAIHRVIGIAELLEKILVELPLRTLFTAQRTNTILRNSITNSPKLKRKMFLDSEPFATVPGCPATLNPFLHVSAWCVQNTDGPTFEMQHLVFEPDGILIPPFPRSVENHAIARILSEHQFLEVPYEMGDEWVGDESWTKMLVVQHK